MESSKIEYKIDIPDKHSKLKAEIVYPASNHPV